MIEAGTLRARLNRFLSALVCLAASMAVLASTASAADPDKYGIERVEASLSTTQAGAHADLTTFIELETDPATVPGPNGDKEPWAPTREVVVDLPAGLTGNPNAVETCTLLQFATANEPDGGCPRDSQVGIAVLTVWGINTTLHEPIYNMEAPGGDKVARLGFWAYSVPSLMDVRLRCEDDYGLTTYVQNIVSEFPLVSTDITICSVPADPSHDTEKQTPYEVATSGGSVKSSPPRPSSLDRIAFLTNPTKCGGPLSVDFGALSYPRPDEMKTASAQLPPITGCENLDFPIGSSFRLTSTEADSPSGLDALLTTDQSNFINPDETAPANLRQATVTLPEGVAINPSSAHGLVGCSEEEFGLISESPIRFRATPPGCPEASKVGTVEIVTPVLDGPLNGSLYVTRQFDNPFDTFLAGYLYAQGRGATIKLAGRFDLNPVTGQITATFDENPQQPFESIKLRFKEGNEGVLVTPPRCGTYGVQTAFTPWSSGNATLLTSNVDITSGPGGAPCPNPPAFTPWFDAGTVTPKAGAYSPLVVKAARPDGSQTLRGIDVTLPPGLTAKLAGIPYCPEANIAAAAQKTGLAEQAAPSCSRGSRLGSVTVGAGAGRSPIHVQGTAYLAGPYKGAPLSLVTITPAVAGPFDLGTVVVRAALQVDPVTARVRAVSDQLPTILNGIPLHLRSVVVDADRPGFSRNPTNCEPLQVEGALLGAPDLKAVARHFQVRGCKALAFKPKLALRLQGGTKRAGYPALRATLSARDGEANIKRVSVALPHSEFLAQEHINTVCTRVQYAAEQCPKGSVYGRARAFSPLLDQPLEGPVYLRSSSNELPDLVAALNGQVDIDLAGRIDSVNGGIRTTFTTVPDVPVKKFVLRMRGGKKSLLVNSEDICAGKNRARVTMTAHNGKVRSIKPVLRSSCGKKPSKR